MANEIFIPAAFDSSDVIYVVEYDATGQAWNTDTLTWETHSGTQADYVGHRATIGANGNYGPYSAQPITRLWVAFLTTQSSGNESLTLDESVYDEQVRTSFDRLAALVPQIVTNDLGVVSPTVISFALPEPVGGAVPGLYDGYDVLIYDESAGRRSCRRRIVSSLIQSGVAVEITLDAAPDFVVATNDSLAIITSSAQFERLSDEVGTAGAANRPVNQAVVPPSRTWKLKPNGSDGLVGERPLIVKASSIPKLFAIDFAADLSNNGRVSDINAVSVIEGNPANITLGSDLSNVSDYGVDRSQVKVRITPTTSGTYRIRVSADYDPADGGGGNEGDVTLVVT